MVTIVQYTVKIILVIIVLLFTVSCNVKGADLQDYYVDSYDKPGFIGFDLATSMFNVDQSELSADEKEIYKSVKKLNILMLPTTDKNYATEKNRVTAILKEKDFEQLMSFNSGAMNGKLYYIGDDKSVDEVIVYGSNAEKGFALIRLLGKDMKPENVGKLMKIFQKSDFDGNPLAPVMNFFNGTTEKVE